MTRLGWILGYVSLQIWRKIGLSGLCTALRTRSDACYCWIGLSGGTGETITTYFDSKYNSGCKIDLR